jgi:prolyl-tRNA editing enzyme YbaK/EbsC (Cys-tRNA(Pro) deacylase)
MFMANYIFQVDTSHMDLQDRIKEILAASGLAHEILACDPALADTATFCAHYGYAPEISANAILVKSKTGEAKFAVCIVLATTRLDVNKAVRKKLGARKVSFADAAETIAMTGMEIGGVTAIGLPPDLPLWIDARIMACDSIILGGGDRASKIVVDPKIFEQTPNAEVVTDLAKEIPQESANT